MSTEFPEKSSQQIQADIEQTRQGMDNTIDALADRFQSRHLVDEVVGYFRSGASEVSHRAGEIKEKVADTASRAAQSVADTVKRHPVPTVLIGAGVAWIVYQRLKDSSPHYRRNRDNDQEFHYDAPDDNYSINVEDELSSAKKPLSSSVDKMSSAAASVGSQVKERASQIRQKAGEIGSQVQESTRRVYERSRDQIVDTVQARPVEVGLGLLALGVLVGLALPTSDRINESIGPRADKLRDRAKELGKDLVERSKHVATAAADAARGEAQLQGLTPANLGGKNGATPVSDKESPTAQADGPVGFASNSFPTQTPSDGLPTGNAAEI